VSLLSPCCSSLLAFLFIRGRSAIPPSLFFPPYFSLLGNRCRPPIMVPLSLFRGPRLPISRQEVVFFLFGSGSVFSSPFFVPSENRGGDVKASSCFLRKRAVRRSFFSSEEGGEKILPREEGFLGSPHPKSWEAFKRSPSILFNERGKFFLSLEISAQPFFISREVFFCMDEGDRGRTLPPLISPSLR